MDVACALDNNHLGMVHLLVCTKWVKLGCSSLSNQENDYCAIRTRLATYKRQLFHLDDAALRELPCVVLCANIHLARTLELYIHQHMRTYYAHLQLSGHLKSEEIYSLEAAPIISQLLLLKSQSTAKQLLWGLCFFKNEASKSESSKLASRKKPVPFAAPA